MFLLTYPCPYILFRSSAATIRPPPQKHRMIAAVRSWCLAIAIVARLGRCDTECVRGRLCARERFRRRSAGYPWRDGGDGCGQHPTDGDGRRRVPATRGGGIIRRVKRSTVAAYAVTVTSSHAPPLVGPHTLSIWRANNTLCAYTGYRYYELVSNSPIILYFELVNNIICFIEMIIFLIFSDFIFSFNENNIRVSETLKK